MFVLPGLPQPLAFRAAKADPLAAPFDWSRVDFVALGLAAAFLFLAGAFASLRRALAESSSERVLERVAEGPARDRLRRVYGRLDRLLASASLLEVLFRLLFIASVLRVAALGEPLRWGTLLGAVAVCAPLLWFSTEALGRAFALRYGEALLARTLPAFAAAQLPIAMLGHVFALAQRSMLRAVGIRSDPESTRELVAGLRAVIADAEVSGKLDETEKRIIGNVMEFRDVDVAAIMTPRTEIRAADVSEGVAGAAALAAESAHSRIPVYEGALDHIIGTISARDLVQVLASGEAQRADLRALLRPAYFVPETKPLSELLPEMRRQRIKMAIVLDEYGGTAGLATMGDVLAELVGEIPDEYDEISPAPLRRLPGGAAEIDASLHVKEVNAAMDLMIPEESDFETLGGFVLASLGHFPSRGERFARDGAEYTVVEASDRRVLKVRVRKHEPAGA